MKTKPPLSKQTREIYSLLLKEGPLSAEEIGKKLNIFPNAVYRLTKQLLVLGCLIQSGSRPTIFHAISPTDSVETFSLIQKEWFLKTFLSNNSNNQSNMPIISFIESREDMFEKAISDINNLKYEMNNLASGDELPAEIMLAQKNALDRGVKIRTLFQKRNENNEEFIKVRTKMGEEIRISETLNSRIVIFDKKIVYIMSYDPKNYIKSMGIRFEYEPFGQMMYDQFQKQWEKGLKL